MFTRLPLLDSSARSSSCCLTRALVARSLCCSCSRCLVASASSLRRCSTSRRSDSFLSASLCSAAFFSISLRSFWFPGESERLKTGDLECEVQMPRAEIDQLQKGDLLAIEVGEAGEEEVRNAALEFLHKGQSLVAVFAMAPVGLGTWAQKTWSLEQREGTAVTEQHSFSRHIARVELDRGRLSCGSLELLRRRGVGV